jgi:phage baseplate assembly protein W
LDFIPHPTTGDVVKKTGPDAVKRAIRNLIFTNFYDRPFRSYIGSGVTKRLFDNIGVLSRNVIKDAINEVIVNYEPRVTVEGINVEVAEDNNGFNVMIYCTIIDRAEPLVIDMFLERVR